MRRLCEEQNLINRKFVLKTVSLIKHFNHLEHIDYLRSMSNQVFLLLQRTVQCNFR